MTQRILVTGGRGRLARALVAAGGERVCALSHAELDVADAAAAEAAVVRLRPLAVINAAVVSNVDAAQADIDRARIVNATAPGLLADVCARTGTPLIHVSTDYVFGAATERPWREEDPVSPINAYGRMKADGELAVLRSGARACIARVAWLFGDGEDFIARMLRNADQDPVRVADDQVGSPTPLGPLAVRLLDLAGRMAAEDPAIPPILHLAGSPPVSRADWVATAFEALERAGRSPPRLERISMDAFPSTAPRPCFSALDCSKAANLFGGEIDWRAVAARAETFP